MSDIVIELQKDIINEEKTLSSLLRKAYFIAKKLQLDEWSSWIKKEMNGYGESDSIPDYRKVKGVIKGRNPFYGWVPVDFCDIETENIISFYDVKQSIADIETLISDKSSKLSIQLPMSVAKQLGVNTEIRNFIGVGSISNIINCTRNKLLDWSLELQNKGIKGTNMEFLEEEVEKAKDTAPTSIIYNISGEIHGGIQTSHNSNTVTQTQNNRPENIFAKICSWIKSKIFNGR